MDALKLIETLARSEFVQTELPMNQQFGLPWLEKRGGRLCLCFKAHREELEGEELWYYPPQFELVWVWPFEHLESFRRLDPADASTPAARVPVKRLLSSGRYGLDELYQECSRVLSIREKNGELTDAWLRSYQKKYRETVAELGLQAVYGEE